MSIKQENIHKNARLTVTAHFSLKVESRFGFVFLTNPQRKCSYNNGMNSPNTRKRSCLSDDLSKY